MEGMLHRGSHAIASEEKFKTISSRKLTWGRLIGLDEHFTFGDRLLAGGIFSWSILWLGVFLVGTVWNLVAPWPTAAWSAFWFVVGIGIPICFTFVTAFWFTWGGIRDMRHYFERLRHERIDVLDNGMVVNHRNAGEPAK
jgi:SSS family solute:Na+ symporter